MKYILRNFKLKNWIITIIGISFCIAYVIASGYVVRLIESFVDIIGGEKQADWLIPDPKNKIQAVINLTAFSFGLIIFSFIIKIIGRIMLLKQTLLASNLFKNQIYYKINNLSLEEFYGYKKSTLINRINVDYAKLEKTAINVLVYMIECCFELLVYISFSIALSPYLSIIYLIFIPLIIFIIVRGSRKTEDHYQDSYKSLDNLNQVIRENITGLKVVRIFNLEEFQTARYDDHHKSWFKSIIRADLILTSMYHLIFLAINIFITLVLVTSGYLNKVNSNLSPGTVIGFLNYLTFSSYVVIAIADYALNMIKTRPVQHRFKEILELKNEDLDKNKLTNPIVGKIEFRNLNYKYEQNNFNVLKNINLMINPGENIGIIGSIGSGKSTICSLLSGIKKPNDNSIFIDGIDINQYNIKHIRKNVSYDFQKKLLFSGTIKSNIVKANLQATQKQIDQVINYACADEFINNFSDKLDHQLVEFGNNLSGGQKARVCIARTLIKDSKIMIFDDSLTALDNITAKKVLDNILDNYKDKTKIFISQQIRNIKDLDKIIVLDKGNVVGFDTHINLLSDCNVYKEIYDSQKKIGDDV
ncbi:ABC transporter ATP-binding protein [Mycoplasma bradburyae]|uniref:ABC transporter ATP-binding protein/permease n=2 Tax=Mycoplasma bradburyae TaxID=2963128 RepID=A0ABT5GBB6_9MOLU|nr:ABC transporter ATP-binding protein [Mycoplasma bradburyae]MDC4182284.1 ABC transporter ATP-binding protein/permease [Mycoplasma bradburyae]MDC4182777.1 ABC transporter ATP-binding protein/permease [Mycoplasma bradburyae]UTS69790.1 ABC transporter ATP-binding protein/permease [Mycoplasma bradburyae]